MSKPIDLATKASLVIEAHPSTSSTPVDTTWVEQHSSMAVAWKQAIARYVSFHYIRYGDAALIGSGTQMRFFYDAIQDRQRQQEKCLDLLVLTTNLEVVAKANPPGKYSMRVLLTGGQILESLYCLSGEYAAKAVLSEMFSPRVVVFGAAGIRFADQWPLSYHFPDEVSTQEAYATRPTEHRIIMCDHTKLGFHDGLKAGVDLAALLDKAETCTVVTSMPDDDETVKERLLREQEALRKKLRFLAVDNRYKGKNFVLEFVSRDSKLISGVSLQEERTQVGA